MLNRVRILLRHGSTAAGVGFISAIGAFTGLRRKTDVIDVLVAISVERSDELPERSKEMLERMLMMVAISHDLGRLIRDEMDHLSFKRAMKDFKKAMGRKERSR